VDTKTRNEVRAQKAKVLILESRLNISQFDPSMKKLKSDDCQRL